MSRTTRQDLDDLAFLINTLVEQPGEYFIQKAYGQPRLYRAQGSVEVSPRLPMGEMRRWMYAFIHGIEVGKRI